MTTIRGYRDCQNALAATVLLVFASSPVHGQIIANGGFETGFGGWTRADQLGSIGTFFVQSGLTSPSNGTAVPAPAGGLQAAMSDGQGPGSHVLYHDFVIPATPIVFAQLRFDLFIGNRATAFSTPATLDFSTPTLNQQARVDIISTTADPFSVAPPDVLQNAFQTAIGSPLVTGYSTVFVDVTALAQANGGNTLRLRFSEVDNVAAFQMGIDNVVFAVPEPSSIVFGGLCGLFGLTRWRRNGSVSRPGVS